MNADQVTALSKIAAASTAKQTAANSFLNIDTSRSYATESNLMMALKGFGLDGMMPLVVCNRSGRFTAVFGLHNSGMAKSGDVMRAGNLGFKTID